VSDRLAPRESAAASAAARSGGPAGTSAAAPAELTAHLLGELHASADPANVAGMARYGISSAGTLGVSMPRVRELARDARRELGGDPAARHETAGLLWKSGVHEARILASLLDVPALVTESQMESWVADLDSWDVCDTLMNNLFRRAPAAWVKAAEWPLREAPYVKRAGFVLGATLAVHDTSADDARFLALLALAEAEAVDDRNFVRKAVNWQIRQIGKRSPALNTEAIETCERILAAHSDNKAARWVARGALRELRSDAIRARLGLAVD